MTAYICARCGGAFERHQAPSHRRRFPPKYCSRQCIAGPARQRFIEISGYVLVRMPAHPRATKQGYVLEHLVIIERAYGGSLPADAQAHHVNGNKADNRNCNLVLCENPAYHGLLHQRTRALRACGNPTWRRCYHCKQYDAPERLYEIGERGSTRHRSCHAKVERDRLRLRRAAYVNDTRWPV